MSVAREIVRRGRVVPLRRRRWRAPGWLWAVGTLAFALAAVVAAGVVMFSVVALFVGR